MNKIMNRIGFTLLFLGTLLFLNTSCQNFFWSHRCCDADTVIPSQTQYGFVYNWWAAIGDTDRDEVSEEFISSSSDWILPSDNMLKTLELYIGMPLVDVNAFNWRGTTEGGELKITGTTYWLTPNTGATNEWGMDLRSGLNRSTNGVLEPINRELLTLHTTSGGTGRLINVYLTRQVKYNESRINRVYENKGEGWPILLVNPNTTLSHGESGSYIGNNGIIYPTICIGTQEWTIKFLEETLYRSGTPIHLIANDAAGIAEWDAATTNHDPGYSIHPDTF